MEHVHITEVLKARSSIGIHFSDKNEYKIEDISEKLNVKNHSNNIAEASSNKKITRNCNRK